MEDEHNRASDLYVVVHMVKQYGEAGYTPYRHSYFFTFLAAPACAISNRPSTSVENTRMSAGLKPLKTARTSRKRS